MIEVDLDHVIDIIEEKKKRIAERIMGGRLDTDRELCHTLGKLRVLTELVHELKDMEQRYVGGDEEGGTVLEE